MKQLKKDDIEYLRGKFAAFDDLPDGAWAQCCQDAVRDDPRFKGKNPYDVWIAWVAATSVEKK
jgi:hypothetical protein